MPPGVRIPLTIYGNPDNDRVATAGDVILVTGSGDVVLFRLVSPDHGNEQLRPAMANDPAIRQFGWEGKVSALYQPPFGSFHQMVRLVDGVFVLVDTAGRRTYFSADGRLDRIVFPYEASRLQCRYRADGRLDRVIGDGNTEIKFGYYDFSSSPAFQLGQDFPTEKATEAGLIARVQHGDRQVRYFFDTSGNLDHVDGVGGRSVYGYDLESPHQLTAISRETGGQPPGQRIFYTDGLVTAVEVDGQNLCVCLPLCFHRSGQGQQLTHAVPSDERRRVSGDDRRIDDGRVGGAFA